VANPVVKTAMLPAGDYGRDALTERAVSFLRAQRAGPFFLHLSHYFVHDPIHSRAPWLIEKYAARLPAGTDRRRVEYAAMVETLDHLVGRVLRALDELGLAENTLVVFTSDNGGHPGYAANGPLRGSKWNLYEGGVRVPWIVRWPGKVPANVTSDTPFIGTDLLPTLAAATGAELPKGVALDGRNVLPLWRGEAQSAAARERPLIWHFPYYHPETGFAKARPAIGVDDFAVSQTRPQSAIRVGEWKLVHFYEENRDELYHLTSDVSEQHDLARREPARARDLRRQLEDYLREAGARLPTSAPSLYFPPAAGDWEPVLPGKVGWDEVKLQTALELAGKTHASGVVILHRGRILAEQYWNPESDAPAGKKAREYATLVRGRDAAGRVIEDVASVQKSIAAILVGMAQSRGLLRLEDPVSRHLGPGWSKAAREQEAAITVRHLVTMTSGLKDDLTFEAAAGTRWRYNSAAYARSVQVVAAVARQTPNDVTRAWLTGPLGMKDSRWVERPGAAREAAANPLGFATTARDLARFGLFILAEGQWRDATIFPDRDYLRAALRPSQALNPSYGYLWWLNGQPEVARGAGERVKGPLIPTAPPDLVAALGAVDRKLYVVPSLGLVVSRLGNSAGPAFQSDFWKLLMAAAPKP
jgi:CubicO group peptidase (beta-lactamase class C family)